MKPTEVMWHTIAADLAAVNSSSHLEKDATLTNEGRAQLGDEEGHQKSELKDQEGVSGRTVRSMEVVHERVAGERLSRIPDNVADEPESKEPKQNRPGASEVLFEELKNKSKDGAAGPPEQQEPENLGGVLPQSNVPVLPPVIEKVKRVFFSLNAICGFLQKQHMQPTWQNVKQALQQLCCNEEEKVNVQDIHLLALLCPRVS
jgi:hypothetical protein